MSKDMKAEPAEAVDTIEDEEDAEAAAPETSEIEKEPQPTNSLEEKGSVEKPAKVTKAAQKKKEKSKAEKKEETKPGKEEAEDKEEKEEEEKVIEEKTLTVNLRHAYLAYSRKPTPRSVNLVRKVALKVFKTEDVKIDNSLNSILWSRGKTKAERRVAIKVQKLEDGSVRVLPATEA
jgi:large subunit ribosomal protein L31e